MGSSTKIALYVTKALKALSSLGSTLGRNIRTMWKIARITTKVAKLSFKGFTLTVSPVLRLFPFLPPVVVGLHVLFSAFWPQRILFFSTSQRRTFLSNQLWHWAWVLGFLLMALITNTYLVELLRAYLDESLPLLSVYVRRKFGWKMALAASGAAIASSLCFIVAYFILAWNTSNDHENLTNEEVEWKLMLKKKRKVMYKTALGDKVEWANQVKYKKERINGWTWFPIDSFF